ncbi:hypothetical protein BDV59DRAFT_198259 [Aspergillus ambiguus]|uniref:uncharacterized protein n=1 Tax=Aspergillus ambiguus TaxID=176160 RepID=UPI003CCDC474
MSPVALISSRFESSPQSSWQRKCLLHEIKRLYIQRQYKQCATRASDLLQTAPEPIHPVHKTYLYFYSAISYEAMGRAAHNYSHKKLSLLHSALDCFVTCSAVLPSPITSSSPEDDGGSSQCSLRDSLISDRPSSSSSLMSSITDMIDKSIDSPDDDPFLSDTEPVESPFTAQLHAAQPTKPRLVPPPLKVRKSTDNISLHPLKLSATGDSDDSASSRISNTTERPNRVRPPPLPIKIVPFTASNARRQRNERRNPSPKPLHIPLLAHKEPQASWMPDVSVTRYNGNIRSLRVEISSSIAAIHALIDEITELQEARRATRNFRRSASFWSFSPVKKDSARVHEHTALLGHGSTIRETKEQRIARLRADGWNTVGLKAVQRGWKGAEYYQIYCAAVLSEMYLDR